MADNCLLITVDSLRSDFPLTRDASAFEALGGMAADSMTFTEAFSTGPGTNSSFPGLLTGTLPLSYGGLGPLSESRPRLARYLSDAGVSTGAFHSNPFLSRYFNYDSGFDRFTDYQNPLMGFATKLFPRGIEINNPKLRFLDEKLHLTDAIKGFYQLVKGKPRPYVAADVIADDTIDWLREVREPYFAWAHFMDVHHPCFPPFEYRERYGVEEVKQGDVTQIYSKMVRQPEAITEDDVAVAIRLYDAAIEFTFDQIRRILRVLRGSEQYGDTVVFITSDHGELFGEYGRYAKPMRMYEELIHVPLIVVNPPDTIQGMDDELVSLLDLPPTIHHLLGVDVPEVYDGRRLGVDPSREFVMAEHEVEGDVVVGARSRRWSFEQDDIEDETRLYDVKRGRFESDLRSEDPEVKLLITAVHDRLEQLSIEPSELAAVEGDVRDRLEDLGYL